MRSYKIAVIPGDGIGIEVMNQAIKALNKLAEISGEVCFEFEYYEWGCEYYLKHGRMMSEDGMELLKGYDAILLGAVGYPGVPDHVSLHDLLLRIRKEFRQYINYRPIKLFRNCFCPLKEKQPQDVDMVFIRENVEGEYCGMGGTFGQGDEEIAMQMAVFTRKNTERVIRYAFETAKKLGRKKLTSVTKSNALNYSMVFWDKIFAEIGAEYPDIMQESMHVDAAALQMILKPERFEVMVGSNLFGDILTDLGGAIQGGLGFAAGANINPARDYPSMFEPVHGSAPDIAGQGKANPIAMILTAQLMLEHLGEKEFAAAIEQAVTAILDDKQKLTCDMGGSATTDLVGDFVCENIRL